MQGKIREAFKIINNKDFTNTIFIPDFNRNFADEESCATIYSEEIK